MQIKLHRDMNELNNARFTSLSCQNESGDQQVA